MLNIDRRTLSQVDLFGDLRPTRPFELHLVFSRGHVAHTQWRYPGRGLLICSSNFERDTGRISFYDKLSGFPGQRDHAKVIDGSIGDRQLDQLACVPWKLQFEGLLADRQMVAGKGRRADGLTVPSDGRSRRLGIKHYKSLLYNLRGCRRLTMGQEAYTDHGCQRRQPKQDHADCDEPQ